MGFTEFSQAIDHFGRPIVLRRRAPGSYDADGRWIDGLPFDDRITAVVYPATGEDLVMLPEAARSHEAVVVFTEKPLLVPRAGSSDSVDKLLFDGRSYAVHTSARWEPGGYYRAVAVADREAEPVSFFLLTEQGFFLTQEDGGKLTL